MLRCRHQAFFFVLLLTLVSRQETAAQYILDTLSSSPDINFPIAIAFPPDTSARLFFTEKNGGRVRIVRHDTLLAEPFVTVDVYAGSESGLLGITFHPSYPDSPYVYIFYTRSDDRRSQIVRYTDQQNVGMDPETLFVVSSPSSGLHVGGNLHFGPDNKLYVTVGNNLIDANSQDTSNAVKPGKIHRLNSDGTIPSDNPIPGNSLYAYGIRNSFDFTFDQLTGTCYASENGPNCDDEINLILPGRNYGWPIEGNCIYSTNPQYVRPLYYWPSVIVPTGIMVYRGNTIPKLDRKLLIGSFINNAIYQFDLSGTGDSIASQPATVMSFGTGITDLEAGPDGNIYISASSYAGVGNIFRLRALVPPSPPTLVSPFNGETNQHLPLNFHWQRSRDASAYRLQVADDSLFTTLITDDSLITQTTRSVSDLQHDTWYYWRVSARNNAGSGLFSEVWRFKTILETPMTGGAHGPSLAPTLVWNAVKGVETYRLQISTEPAFSTFILEDPAITDTLRTLDTLQDQTRYFWRLRAENNDGRSDWSAASYWDGINEKKVYNFHFARGWNMISIPLAVQHSQTDFLFLNAGSSAFGYTGEYTVADSLLRGSGYWLKFPSDQFVNLTGDPTSSETLAVQAGWNMIGSLSGALPASSVTSDPPNLVTSRFFAYIDGYLTVDTVLPANGYWVKVDQNGKLILSASSTVASSDRITIVPTAELPPPLPGEPGIVPIVSRPAPDDPKQFALEQNYPNPFNPKTDFDFRIARQGGALVTLKVFNVLGEEVAVLVNERKEPGEYHVSWDSGTMPGGVYFYRLQAGGNFTATKKMILVK